MPPPPRARHLHIALHKSERPSPPSQPSPSYLEIPIPRDGSEPLADLLAVDWGLTDLRLENGTFESDDCLKPVLHALLISGTLSSLSLAGNKRLRAPGWRLLAVFMQKVCSHIHGIEHVSKAESQLTRPCRRDHYVSWMYLIQLGIRKVSIISSKHSRARRLLLVRHPHQPAQWVWSMAGLIPLRSQRPRRQSTRR